MTILVAHRDGWMAADSAAAVNGQFISLSTQKLYRGLWQAQPVVYGICGYADWLITQSGWEEGELNLDVGSLRSVLMAQDDPEKCSGTCVLLCSKVVPPTLIAGDGSTHYWKEFIAVGCGEDQVLGYLQAVQDLENSVQQHHAEKAIEQAMKREPYLAGRIQFLDWKV